MSQESRSPVDDYIAMLREQRNNAMEDAALASARALGLSRELSKAHKRITELESKQESHAPAA